ncbi:MAG: hypothetical protein V1778_04735, partial [bacterium]
TKTSADYWFVKRRVHARQHRIIRNYKRREFYRKFTGKAPKPFILNVEELASIFHFPVMTVKAPQLQKTEARRGEPPIRLPMESIQEEPTYAAPTTPPSPAPVRKPHAGEPPLNLPT